MIDRVEERMDECKGRINCILEYFSAVTLDRMLSSPAWDVGQRARGILTKAAGRSQRPALARQGGAKIGQGLTDRLVNKFVTGRRV